MKTLLIVAFTQFFIFPLRAEITFFEKEEIDYWDLQKNPQKEIKFKVVPEIKAQRTKVKIKNQNASWSTYLSPKTLNDYKEVFREGDYTPPVPLLLGIMNPTYQNAQNWLKYIKFKNSLSRPFLAKIQEIKSREEKQSTKQSLEKVEKSISEQTKTANNWDRFRFRMYFDQECPHCKRMFKTLSQLKKRGFYVEAVQIDDGKRFRYEDIPIFKATVHELKKYSVERVPFTLVADMKKRKLLNPIRGHHSISSVTSFLNQLAH